MANDREIAHQVLGILGNIASCAFFLSSAPTVIRIIRSKSSGDLSGDLYIFKLCNCLLWAFYGLPFIHPHDFWVVLTNSFGCAFALMYIFPYIVYATRKEQFSMLCKLCAVVACFLIMAIVLLFEDRSQQNRIMAVGILCVFVSSGMHMTLLSQTGMALRSKDPTYLQPNASVAAFIKGAIWTTYGIVNLDVYIVIPNGVGVAIGVIQSLLLVMLMGAQQKEEAQMKVSTELKANPMQLINVDSIDKAADYRPELDQKQGELGKVPSLLGIGGPVQRQSSMSRAVVVPIEVLDSDDNPV